MSYEGTYGPGETCPHDIYWKSCMYCSEIGPNPTPEQIAAACENQAKRKCNYLAHPADILTITPTSRTVTVYDAKCPNPSCGWSRTGVLKEEMDRALAEHRSFAVPIAAMWSVVDPEKAWVAP